MSTLCIDAPLCSLADSDWVEVKAVLGSTRSLVGIEGNIDTKSAIQYSSISVAETQNQSKYSVIVKINIKFYKNKFCYHWFILFYYQNW